MLSFIPLVSPSFDQKEQNCFGPPILLHNCAYAYFNLGNTVFVVFTVEKLFILLIFICFILKENLDDGVNEEDKDGHGVDWHDYVHSTSSSLKKEKHLKTQLQIYNY